MTLHLLKLCVGCDSIAALERWIEEDRLLHRRMGGEYRQIHTTRQTPKHSEGILDGGSLYWVIKGWISARQTLVGIEPFTGPDGIARSHLVLDPCVIRVSPRPCRAFQGWRYLSPQDAPPDTASGAVTGDMPEVLRSELAALGLL